MTTQHSPASGYRERNSTADRALTILGLFTEDHTLVSAMEITEALGVARSTAYRYAQSLIGAGFLEEVPGHGFQLGHRILELALIARRSQGYSEVALPHMREIVAQFRHTAVLARLSGASVVCLEQETCADSHVRISYERGEVVDLNTGATAVMLLAQLKEEQARRLLESRPVSQHSAHTPASTAAILTNVRAARRDGYIVGHGTLDPRAVGIAVPVRSTRAPLTLAVVAVGPLSAREANTIVAALKRSAAAIGERLELLEG